ncbi:MAG: histidine phosphatase family protein [Clostridia bacterium]|nr:histidine phosphatase family protein [Clostridia bacterium]
MTHIYFVRHAQPDYRSGVNRTFPLSDEGMEDRHKALAVLKNVSFDRAVSSPYRRSIDTIMPLVESMGLELTLDERLRERDNAGGSSNSREMFRKRWADHDFCEEGGESIRSTQERNVAALNDILTNYAGETILVGTHGTALSTIINYYRPEFGFEQFLRIIDFMPYVLHCTFDGVQLAGMEELFYLHKEYHGVK